MLKKSLYLFLFILLYSFSFAFNGWLGIKNEKFTIFYKQENEYAAKELMKNLNESASVAEKTTSNYNGRTYFVIDDFGSVVNGFADPVTSDSIHVFCFPPDSSELAMSENWYKTVGIHEYTHMLHMKNCSEIPEILKFVYGNIFQPNVWSPPWILEGITTYTESKFSKYSGRLNEGYFDAYLMARLSEGKDLKISDVNYSSIGFPYGSYYMYGGLFFRYLSNKYGEEKFGKFFYEYGSSLKSYISPVVPAWGIDKVCFSVYGKSFPDLWKEWIAYEKKRAISFKQDGEKISDIDDYAEGTSVYKGSLYYVRKYLNTTSASTSSAKYEIWRKDLATNKDEVFFKYSSEIFPNLIFKNDSLYFSVVNYTTGFKNSSQYSYGAEKRVLKLNLSTKEYSEILKERFRTFTVDSSDNIIYTVDKKDSFGSNIYKFSPSDNSTLKLSNTNMLIAEIKEYNNRFFTVSKNESANFGIFEFNFTDNSFKTIADTPYLEGQISIYDDKLFFVSNNNSQYRSYFYDLISNESHSLTESGYSTYPAYCIDNNTLYYIGITSKGNNIFKKILNPIKSEFVEYAQPENSPESHTKLKYEKASYSENLKSLLHPTGRSFGYSNSDGKNYYSVAFSGSDKVWDIPYYSLYLEYDDSKKEKFDFSFLIENNLLLPVQNYLAIDRDSLTTAFSYPVIANSKPGIESLSVGTVIKSDYDFKVNSIAPAVSLGIQYPSFSAAVNIEAPFENKSFSDTSQDRFGIITSAYARKSFSNSFIQGNLANYYNPDYALTDRELPSVRGYSKEFNNSDSVYGSLNYSLNLFKIRKGLWNPNVYAGDLSINIFADTAFERQNSNSRQLSAGAEISTMTALGFGMFPLTPTVRVSFPENKSPMFDFLLMSSF